MLNPGRHLAGSSGQPTGAPTAGRARLDAIRQGATRSSLESAASAAALAGAGFDLVSEVMGCVVLHLGNTRVSCGFGTYPADIYAEPPTLVSGRAGDSMPLGDVVQETWNIAHGRLFAEAGRVGADGVIGIRATRGPVPGADGGEEFLLLGTAVRARGGTRPSALFGTEQDGAGVVALLAAGLVPCGYAVTAAVGIRHDDWRTRQANTRWSGNEELPGSTELAQETRQGARDQFGDALDRLGAEQALASTVSARMWEIEGESHTDHLCEVTVMGTGLVSYRRGTAPRALTVLPMSKGPAPVITTLPGGRPERRPGGPTRWQEATSALRAARVRRTLKR